ncbi:diacylglycerol/lipid kinase family protein [Nocardioides bizhenqiangii]|uniref:Diacylglycerol kinase family protein n=1 Tax=Nocardioides bizhenqiangii TaxID=3095076 RepID=A0ABZ0ZSJ2_9ACTN|nr:MULTISPECIES: diacylglycerol kinase family protein [unclassified Nocardioides]MDZ5619515.1 diacylglycerol kinase family protein [Nocardioides sp. HM23]WQQ26468.1 diacylglycerol kinase family protein [Nocardioides sp. HM61]
MTSRSFTFLVNPNSGGGTAPKVVLPLARRLREAGAEVEVSYTSSAAVVPDLVKVAAAAGRVVVSVGGDGMLSSVAGAVVDAGGELAVIPAGRGNDFARMLEVPSDEDAQVALLLGGKPTPVDLLSVSMPGRPAVLVAGSVYAGVDARAAEIVDRSHWLPNRLQYPIASIRALGTYRPAALTVEIDGRRTEHRAANVVIANSRFYGKGMDIAPDARIDDGVLDVVVIEAAGRVDLIRSLPKVYDGAHVALAAVKVLRGTRVTVSGRYDGTAAPVPVGADGESLGDLPATGEQPLTVEIRPGAVKVLR